MFHDFQGTNADQDNRFSDKEKKLLKQMKFEEILSKKVKKGFFELFYIDSFHTESFSAFKFRLFSTRNINRYF
jgi:hypothetical protein